MFATPIHLTRIVSINKPTLRVRYEYQDHEHPVLEDVLLTRLQTLRESKGFARVNLAAINLEGDHDPRKRVVSMPGLWQFGRT